MTNDITDTELSDYILSVLAKQTGRGRGYWRRTIGGVVIRTECDDGSNWSLQLPGAADDAAHIEAVISPIRQEFPFVVKH